MNYKRIYNLPSNLDREVAIRNVEHYLSLLCAVKYWKVDSFPPYLSIDTLPHLMKHCTGPLTVRQFLEMTNKDEVHLLVAKLESQIYPLANVFEFNQLCDPYFRLKSLLNLLETFDDC